MNKGKGDAGGGVLKNTTLTIAFFWIFYTEFGSCEAIEFCVRYPVKSELRLDVETHLDIK